MVQPAKDDIYNILEKAVQNFWSINKDFFKVTDETIQTEWNIAAHFAYSLHKFFPDYHFDLELIKQNYERKRPDIVIHKRGTNKSNLLVVEIKRNGLVRNTESDLNKIQEYWFEAPLNYRYGVVVNFISTANTPLQLLENKNHGV